jgi:hypothetical protein
MLFASSLIAGSGALLAASPMFSGDGNSLGAWISGLGVAGLVIGFLLIRWIVNSIDDTEGHRSPWRSHRSPARSSVPDRKWVTEGPGPDQGQGDSRDASRGVREGGAAARTWRWYVIRLELAAAIVAAGIAVLLIVASPNTMGGGGGPLDWWTTRAGLAGLAVGLIAMTRIYRAEPEASASSWRALRGK